MTIRELGEKCLAELEQLVISYGLDSKQNENDSENDCDGLGRISDLEVQVEDLRRSVQKLEVTKKQKKENIAALNSELKETITQLDHMQKENHALRGEISECQQRLIHAKAGFSKKDVAYLEEKKKKLHASLLLTGVLFDEGSTINGRIINRSTIHMHHFSLGSNSEDATKKLWEKIEQSTFPHEEIPKKCAQ